MRKPTPIKPMGVSINDTISKRIARGLFKAVIYIIVTLALCALMLEWLVGCGETYIDAKGVRHAYECLFINR